MVDVTSAGAGIEVEFWLRKVRSAAEDLQLLYYDGGSWDHRADLGAYGGDGSQWIHYDDVVDDSRYFCSSFRMGFLPRLPSGDQVWIDDVRITLVDDEIEVYSGDPGVEVRWDVWYDERGSVQEADAMAWILSHYYPVTEEPVGYADNQKASFTQQAIWYVLDPTIVVEQPAQAIAAEAQAAQLPAALRLSLAQAAGVNTVAATVVHDVDAPVAGQRVAFSVTGDNAGAAGTCSPSDCTTDGDGQVAFAYQAASDDCDTITAVADYVAPGLRARSHCTLVGTDSVTHTLLMGDPQAASLKESLEAGSGSTAVTISAAGPQARAGVCGGLVGLGLTLVAGYALGHGPRRWRRG